MRGQRPEPSVGMHLSHWLCGYPYCRGGTAVIYCPEQSSGRRGNRRAPAVPGEERRCVRMMPCPDAVRLGGLRIPTVLGPGKAEVGSAGRRPTRSLPTAEHRASGAPTKPQTISPASQCCCATGGGRWITPLRARARGAWGQRSPLLWVPC